MSLWRRFTNLVRRGAVCCCVAVCCSVAVCCCVAVTSDTVERPYIFRHISTRRSTPTLFFCLPPPLPHPAHPSTTSCSLSFSDQRSFADLQGSFADKHGSFAEMQVSFADTQGSFAEIQGCFADKQGSFPDIQGSVVDVQGSFAEIHSLLQIRRAHLALALLQGALMEIKFSFAEIQASFA